MSSDRKLFRLANANTTNDRRLRTIILTTCIILLSAQEPLLENGAKEVGIDGTMLHITYGYATFIRIGIMCIPFPFGTDNILSKHFFVGHGGQYPYPFGICVVCLFAPKKKLPAEEQVLVRTALMEGSMAKQ